MSHLLTIPNENQVRKHQNKATTQQQPLRNITNQHGGKPRGGEKKKEEITVAAETRKRKKSDPMMVDGMEDEVGEVDGEEVEMMEDIVGGKTVEVMEEEVEDIDASDQDDPQAVTPYVNEIYIYMMEKEKFDKIAINYLDHQPDVNEKMRAILVDWLIEVHRMFKLLPETLFLTVKLIDKFVEIVLISRDKLQLVGITSMLIASKYEEIYAPECNDFVYIADGAYTKEQILAMEKTILNALNFNLTSPSALHFLRRYSKAASSDYQVHTLCKYLIELALIDAKLLKHLPSQIAAASVYIARMMTAKLPYWTSTLTKYTTYNEEEVKVVATDLNELLKKAQRSSLKAIRKKYSLPKFGQVALISTVDF